MEMPAIKAETEIKNVFHGLICRPDTTEERTGEAEDRPGGGAGPVASQWQWDRREWKDC